MQTASSINDENLEANDIEEPLLRLPYICGMLECKRYFLNRDNHTLQCYILEMIKSSPSQKLHRNQILRQISSINKFYNSFSASELWLSIELQTETENSLIHVEDNFCCLKGVRSDIAGHQVSEKPVEICPEPQITSCEEKSVGKEGNQENIEATTVESNETLDDIIGPMCNLKQYLSSYEQHLEKVEETRVESEPIVCEEESWISDNSTPELIIDEGDTRCEANYPQEYFPTVPETNNSYNQYMTYFEPQILNENTNNDSRIKNQRNIVKSCPLRPLLRDSTPNINGNELRNSVKNCFKEMSVSKLSSLDIFAIMSLKFPDRYTDEMIFDTLIKNKKMFEMETIPGQSSLSWSLKKPITKKRQYQMTWKQMVAAVLKGKMLTYSEIEEQVHSVFGRKSRGVTIRKRPAFKCLQKNGSFKKCGENWYILEEDYEKVIL